MSKWRVITDEDWKVIEGTVDSVYDVGDSEWDDTGGRGEDAGAALAGDSALWKDGPLKDHARFGASGVDLIPGGWRTDAGVFDYKNEHAYYWALTPSGSSGYDRYLRYDASGFPGVARESNRWTYNKGYGHSVRLLKDDSNGDSDGTTYTSAYTGNDGKTYDAVKVGPFIVLTENLNETKYSDGTNIPIITGDTNWQYDTDGARCYYNNDESTYASIYGALYNYYALSKLIIFVYVRIGGSAVKCPVHVRASGASTDVVVHVK